MHRLGSHSIFPMMLLAAATEGSGAAAPSTPAASITIQGMEFEVDWPYQEGHTCTPGEASALNQTRAENLRNNFAGNIKKAMEDYRKANGMAEDAEVPVANLDQDALQNAFDAYAAKYEFGVRTAGGIRTPLDPVTREAHRIALERIKGQLVKRGITISSVPKEKMGEMVAQVVAKYPDITEEAKRRVESAASIALEGLDFGAAAAPATQAPAGAV